MNDVILALEHLDIGYRRGQPLLSELHLDIEAGSFTALLGSNGAGKSTLLKTILGIIPPLSGHVRRTKQGGRPLRFGYVPQHENLDPLYPFSAFDLALMGVYGRIGAGQIVPSTEKDFVMDCLRSTGAETFSHHRFSELSGGQKQRILIARALATLPDVLVLDEPTSGVDVEATKTIMELISEIHRQHRYTILLVVHDMGIVQEVAEKVIWLHDGSFQHGEVTEVLSHRVPHLMVSR